MKQRNSIPWRIAAIVVAVTGAICSLYFMFSVGSKQKSILLIALFTIWVLSPFVGLFWITKNSNRQVNSSRTAIFYWLTMILAVGSLVAYSGVLIPAGTKGAFIFLVAPFTSWVIIAFALLILRRRS